MKRNYILRVTRISQNGQSQGIIFRETHTNQKVALTRIKEVLKSTPLNGGKIIGSVVYITGCQLTTIFRKEVK